MITCFLVYKSQRLAREIQMFSSVMAEDRWYYFSDDEEDALLDRAYDRWEQLGGAAAARGPLFQFTMQPIGRRRRWREVVERAIQCAITTIAESCPWGQYWHGLDRSVTPSH